MPDVITVELVIFLEKFACLNLEKAIPNSQDLQLPLQKGGPHSSHILTNLLFSTILYFLSALDQLRSWYRNVKTFTRCRTQDLHWTHSVMKTSVGAVSARRQNFATILCVFFYNQSRTYERSRTEFEAYRFAYLLLPLQYIGHRVVAGELDVAVEHNWLAQDGGDVDRILVAKSCEHRVVIQASYRPSCKDQKHQN